LRRSPRRDRANRGHQTVFPRGYGGIFVELTPNGYVANSPATFKEILQIIRMPFCHVAETQFLGDQLQPIRAAQVLAIVLGALPHIRYRGCTFRSKTCDKLRVCHALHFSRLQFRQPTQLARNFALVAQSDSNVVRTASFRGPLTKRRYFERLDVAAPFVQFPPAVFFEFDFHISALPQ